MLCGHLRLIEMEVNDGGCRYCALHYVAKCGHAQLIDLIIVDGTAEAESETRQGLTALHLAVAHNHYHTVTGLVHHMTQDALNHQVPTPPCWKSIGCEAMTSTLSRTHTHNHTHTLLHTHTHTHTWD
jgi:ankyrin repeat protein